MSEIDVASDLAQVNAQIDQVVAQLNQTNTARDQLTQQIHNLNGIAMYLRGKQPLEENSTQLGVDLERTEAYPEDMTKEN